MEVKQRVGVLLAVFVVVTAAVSAVGFWLHHHFAIAYWVFDLGSFGPLAGGLAVLALNRRLGLGARWVPGLGFNVQVVRWPPPPHSRSFCRACSSIRSSAGG